MTPSETDAPNSRLEPRLRPLLAVFGRLRDDPDANMATLREQGARLNRAAGWLLVRHGPRDVETSEVSAPVDGGEIRIRIYRPRSTAGQRLPLYVFLHGGGWCVGNLDERDPRCRTIAAEARCVVASVDYRLAPENRYPVPLEDCYAALCWLAGNGDRFEIDPTRIAIGGESAGGNLAAAVCLLARDRSGPALCHQWLDVPSVDATCTQEGFANVEDGYMLDTAMIDRFLACYLDDAQDRRDPLVSPLFAADHSGLPPAFITTCEFDHLRGDGAAYAEVLTKAGVAAEHARLAGHIHASFALTRLLPSARAHEERAIEALAAAFRRAA